MIKEEDPPFLKTTARDGITRGTEKYDPGDACGATSDIFGCQICVKVVVGIPGATHYAFVDPKQLKIVDRTRSAARMPGKNDSGYPSRSSSAIFYTNIVGTRVVNDPNVGNIYERDQSAHNLVKHTSSLERERTNRE